MANDSRVVLVTGAQQGIGAATALAFAEAGYDVAINWLDDPAAAEAVAGRVRAQGRRGLTVRADVADLEQIAGMMETTVSGLGGLDVLVNNAGVFPRVKFLEMTEAEWDLVIDTNLKGSTFAAQGGGAGNGGSRPRGLDHQSQLAVFGRSGPRCALFCEQGRSRRANAGDGSRACTAWHPRERYRAGPDGYGAATLRQHRGRARRDGQSCAAGAHGAA